MRPIVVMGPSGCGKTTLALQLAAALDRPFVEGDDLHPFANRERMARGEPLTDADRLPFLEAVARALATVPAPVASCSALTRAYRAVLRARAPDLLFVHPLVPQEELQRRVGARAGHFMPASLVGSQLATLEPLGADEAGLVIDGTLAPEEQLARVLERLQHWR
jgi:gluconokinase